MAAHETWKDRINKLTLSRLEEQVDALYRQGRYAEAAKAAKKAAKAAAEVYGQDHPYVNTCRSNLELVGKVAQNGEPPDMVKRPAAEPAGQISARRKPVLIWAAALVAVFFVSAGFVSRYIMPGPVDSETVLASTFVTDGSRPYYKVNADFNPLRKTVEGQEEVTFELREPAPEILFDLYFNRYRNNELNSSEIRKYALQRGNDTGYVEVQWVSYNGRSLSFRQNGEILRVSQQDTAFSRGEHTLKIGFRVKMPFIADRSGANSKGIWLGNWLPTLSADPRKHQPTEIGDPYVGMSSTYEVEFTVPKEYTLVLSNIDSIENRGDKSIYRGKLERVRDLPVFLNRGYRMAVSNAGGTEVRYFYTSSAARPREVLAVAGKALGFFRNKFGEYQWKQLNIVENDMFLNGMEYSTLVLVSTKAMQNSLPQTVFHEVGHQWFYNIVGSDQYDAAFIDEGLVEFYTSTALGWKPQAYQPQISGLNRSLEEFRSWQEYRDIHYRNGKKLFEDIYLLMGKNEFEKFIKEYYDRYKFGLVTAAEFRMMLTGKLGEQAVSGLLNNQIKD